MWTIYRNLTAYILLIYAAVCFNACRPAYHVAEATGKRVAIDSTWDARPDPDMQALIAPYTAGIESLKQDTVGKAATTMKAERPESLLSNLVADVLRDAARTTLGQPADMGLVNIGGLRGSIARGTISRLNIYEILPFENKLCILTLTGHELKQLFANIAARGGEGVSGIRLTISRNGTLLEALVGGQPVDDERLYIIATIDYLAEGNDGMTALKQAKPLDRPAADQATTLRELFLHYVEQQAAEGKAITARLDGRITIRP